MMPKKYIFWLRIFLAIGLGLRLNNLHQRSLWIDEFFTFFNSTGHGSDIKILLDNLSRKENPDLLRAKDFKKFLENDPARNLRDVNAGLISNDTHPPFYFLVMHFWMEAFGDGVFAVRFFSLLLGLVCVFLAYKVTRYLFNVQAALFSGLFMSVCAFSVRFSQEARQYTLVMALGLLTWLFLLRLEKYNKITDAIGFAFFSCLGIYTHYFFALLIAGQFVYFTLTYRKNQFILDKFYLGLLVALLLLFPLYLVITLKGYKFFLAEWIFGYPGVYDKIYNLISGLNRYMAMAKGPFVGIFLLLYLILMALKNNLKNYPRQFGFCAIMFFVPLASMFLVDLIQKGAMLKQERFWVFPFLGIVPLAGLGLYQSFQRNRVFTYIIILFMLMASGLAGRLQFGPAPKDASLWINQESAGRIPAVIAYNTRSVVFPQSYYLKEDAYLIPVSRPEQLKAAIATLSRAADTLFIVRYFHRTDTRLTDNYFMETGDIGFGFKLKDIFYKDDIKVAEYTKCAL